MKRCAVFVLCLAMVIAPSRAAAMTAVFYQPQSRDLGVGAQRWPAIFAKAHAQGFDTLVIQWSHYGDAFGSDAELAWLADRVRQARAAGFAIVLGLGAAPDFFTRQEQPVAGLGPYLRTRAHDDATLARWWTHVLGPDAFVGWYLPLEVDDRRWRDDDALETLKRNLLREVAQLRKIADRPVYLSSFFAGYAAPERYGHILDELTRAGVRVWVQDGAGSGRLTPRERALYLAQAARCQAPVSQGVVYELFRQTSPDAAFQAESLPAADAARALAQRAPCGGDSTYFELRYLPTLEGALPK